MSLILDIAFVWLCIGGLVCWAHMVLLGEQWRHEIRTADSDGPRAVLGPTIVLLVVVMWPGVLPDVLKAVRK